MRRMSTLGNPPLGASVWSVLPSHWTWTTTTSSSFCESGCLICLILRQILVNHYCRFLIFHTYSVCCDSAFCHIVSICGNIKIVSKEICIHFIWFFFWGGGKIRQIRQKNQANFTIGVLKNVQWPWTKFLVKGQSVDTFVSSMSRSYIFFHCPIHFILYSKCNWSKGVQWL